MFTHPSRQDLSSGSIHDCDQVPKLPLKFKVAGIADPNLMGIDGVFRNLMNEVSVVVFVGADGAVVMFDSSPGWSDVVNPHDSLSSFMINTQMESHSFLAIFRTIDMTLIDLFNEYLILNG